MGRAAVWLAVASAASGPVAGDGADAPKATYEVRRGREFVERGPSWEGASDAQRGDPEDPAVRSGTDLWSRSISQHLLSYKSSNQHPPGLFDAGLR